MMRLIVVKIGYTWEVHEADPSLAGGYGALVAGPFRTKRKALEVFKKLMS